FPRYSPEHIEENARLVDTLTRIADDADLTVAQLSLGWLLARSPRVVPIVGTKRVRYVEENAIAAREPLAPSIVAAVDAAFHADDVRGERYRPSAMARLGGKPER
ncbi:MAG: aldo/keto reductase, partial [Pseudomonadota bacterium]